ncbi:serine hydrolase domain-containing protein [Maricaulis sp. CAU 1757]
MPNAIRWIGAGVVSAWAGLMAACTPAGAPAGLAMQNGDVGPGEQLGAVVERYQALGRQHGVVLVMRGDETLLSVSSGMADYEWSVPNTLDAKFGLGSIGKLFTAQLVGRAVADGMIEFDTPVGNILGDLPDGLGEQITIRHLLAHQSGLADFLNDAGADEVADIDYRRRTAGELVELAFAQPLEFEPGSAVDYSNSGYLVLKLVLEALHDRPYCELLESDLLEPLGMHDTGCMVAHRVYGQLAYGHEVRNGEVWRVGPLTNGDVEGVPYSTAADLARFAAAYNRATLLPASVHAEMQRPHGADAWLSEAQGGVHQFGLGIEIFDLAQLSPELRGRIYTHGGGAAGYAAMLQMIPGETREDDIAIIVLNNLRADPIYPELVLTLLGMDAALPDGTSRWPVDEE